MTMNFQRLYDPFNNCIAKKCQNISHCDAIEVLNDYAIIEE